jgi:hypothetical protein
MKAASIRLGMLIRAPVRGKKCDFFTLMAKLGKATAEN